MLDQELGEAATDWWLDEMAPALALRGECIAAFPDGRTVRAWTDVVERSGLKRRWLLRAQVFDTQGNPDSEVFTLSARPSSRAASFRGTPLRERRFAIVWIENSHGDVARRTCTRVFDLRGIPLGDEIELGSVPGEEAASLAIAPSARGGYVAVWVGGDAAGEAHVHAAAFDTLGAARGGVLRVSTHAVSPPCPVRLTRLDGGGFVVSWVDGPTDGPTHSAPGAAPIHTQMFDADGRRVGREFLCSFRA